MKPQKFRYYSISLVFLVLISFPIINQYFHLIQDTKNTENKAPLTKPKIKEHAIDSFPALYEPYFSSNFTIRQRLIKDYYEFHLGIFRKSPHPDQVFIGKYDWLFMGSEENDSYVGSHPLTQEELENFKKELEYRQQFLQNKGIQFYFVIAPIKASIYPEYIPKSVLRKTNKTWAQTLQDYLAKNSTIKVIDLHNTLWEAKKGGNVYFKNDNHWNYRAGLFSTNYILKTIQKDFPQITEIPFTDFKEIVRVGNLSGNLTLMLAQTERYVDSIYEYDPYKGFLAEDLPAIGYPVSPGFPYCQDYELHKGIKGSKQPKLLMISDSFSNYLFPFISERFRQTTKIFDNWEYKRNEFIIENEKPDIVILVVWEANLRHILWNAEEKK
jgi:alginate O-acetyltransferase complex protein AlgJ